MIRCVVFDVGNTLHVADKATLEKCWIQQVEWLKKVHPEISLDSYKEALTNAWKERMSISQKPSRDFELTLRTLEYLGLKADVELAEKLTQIFFEEREKWYGTHNLSPNAKEIFDFLTTKGFLIGVITDSDSLWSRSWLKKVEIIVKPELYLISKEVGIEKSSKEIFEIFLKQLNQIEPTIQPNECLMVGDQPKDLNAKKAGFLTCLYNPKKKDHPELDPKPDYIIQDLIEIKKIVFPDSTTD